MAKKKDKEQKTSTKAVRQVEQVDDVWSLGNMDKHSSEQKVSGKEKSTTRTRKKTTKEPVKKSSQTTVRKSSKAKPTAENKPSQKKPKTQSVQNSTKRQTKKEPEVVVETPAQVQSNEFPITPSVPISKVSFVEEPEIQFAGLEQVLSDLPQDVVDNMPTIQSRINAYLTYFSAMRLGSLPRLFRFIDAAEQIIFNPDDLLHLDFDQIKSVYSGAKATAMETLEQARKVTQTVQTENDKRVDSLYNMLTAMSPDTVARMLEMATEAERENKNNKESTQDKEQDDTE
jgi:hypothetical protein